ncbi:hypothetical protein FACS1894124_7220 [Spirochaetia bacterium]|nr:hypothetical protein FACS1894124_7220 [Spirochaetia bacterium]
MRFVKLNQARMDRVLWYLGLAVLVVALVLILRAKPGLIEIGDRTLVFTQWWQGDLMDAGSLEALVREFEDRNPGIRIKLDTRPYTEIRELLGASDRRSGDPDGDVADKSFAPDIIGIDPRWLWELVQQNRLEPLGAYRARTEAETLWTGDPTTVDPMLVGPETADPTTEGPTGPRTEYPQTSGLGPEVPIRLTSGEGEEAVIGDWARPLVSFMTPLFYNIDMLQAAGFDRPPRNQTEFAAFAKAVTDTNAGRYGFALGLAEQESQGVYRDIFPWIWAAGQPMTAGGVFKFDTPQATAALRFLQGLNKEGVIAPGSFTKTGQDRLEEFRAGKIGMMIASIGDIRALTAAQDHQTVGDLFFGITTIPAPASYPGKPVFGLTNWCAGISRTSKHKNEAWAFIAFLSDRAPRIAAHSGAIHGSSNTADDPLMAKAYDIYEAGGGLEEFAGFPREVFLETVVREEVRRLLEENQTPEYTAAVIEKRAAGGGIR